MSEGFIRGSCEIVPNHTRAQCRAGCHLKAQETRPRGFRIAREDHYAPGFVRRSLKLWLGRICVRALRAWQAVSTALAATFANRERCTKLQVVVLFSDHAKFFPTTITFALSRLYLK